METLLINEQIVSQFKYWREGQMQKGMRFRSNLFEHVALFNYRQRQQVFELAERLTESGKQVVVTASPTQYIVWVNLRRITHSPMSRLSSVPAPVTLTPPAQDLLLEAIPA